MPSPADIPDILLFAAAWPDFVRWLKAQHLTPPDNKKLGSFWAAFNSVRLTREQWREIVPEGW